MSVFYCRRDFAHQLHGCAPSILHPPFSILQPLGQAFPLNPLHREIMTPLLFTHFVNGDNVRMIQRGRCFRLSSETLNFPFRSQIAGADHFQTDNSIEADLARAINYAHASFFSLGEKLEIAKPAPRQGLRSSLPV